jgi:glucose/mannose transport system permease protein
MTSYAHSAGSLAASAGAGAARRRRIRPSRIAVIAFMVIAALFFLVPLYVVFVTSLKPMAEIREGDIFALPRNWTLQAWSFAWFDACSGMTCSGMRVGFINSILVVIPSIVLTMTMSAVTGYALAFWRIKWANLFLFLFFLCAFVPFQIIMYPLIKISAAIGVYGSIFGIAIVHAVLLMPIVTLIFANAYREIPPELMAAAMVDSGKFWRIFLEIIVPMSTNIMLVVLILIVTNVWNDFLIGLTFGSEGRQPMTTILNSLANSATGEAVYNVDMAAALLTAAPPLVIYLLLGRFFVQGISAGAIKG